MESTMKKLSNADYQGMRAVSSHWLIEMMKSPADCWRKYLDPGRKPQKPTASLRFGTLVHGLALTPHQFDNEFIVSDVARRRSVDLAMHATWERAGMTVISPAELDKARAVVAALHANPESRRLLRGGRKEMPIFQPRAAGLLPLKARLDILHPTPRQVVELKTTWSLAKAVDAMERYRYPLSAAFYADRVRARSVVFVFVQTAPPHDVAVIPMERQQLQAGQEQWQSALARFDDCWRRNHWPEAAPAPALEDDPLMMDFMPSKAAARQRFDLPTGELAL